MGIIPVIRGGAAAGFDPLSGCKEALSQGRILILFPEGTRGEPEMLSEIKSGIWYLYRDFPQIPVVPVYLNGLGRAMGKGQWFPIPFFVDIAIGRALPWLPEKALFRASIKDALLNLKQKTMLSAPGPQ